MCNILFSFLILQVWIVIIVTLIRNASIIHERNSRKKQIIHGNMITSAHILWFVWKLKRPLNDLSFEKQFLMCRRTLSAWPFFVRNVENIAREPKMLAQATLPTSLRIGGIVEKGNVFPASLLSLTRNRVNSNRLEIFTLTYVPQPCQNYVKSLSHSCNSPVSIECNNPVLLQFKTKPSQNTATATVTILWLLFQSSVIAL